LDKFEKARKNCINKEFKVYPHELAYFKDGKTILQYKEKQDVTWYIDVKLLDKNKMTVTNIRRESIIKTI